jgi:acyl transferase domain-containing protein
VPAANHSAAAAPILLSVVQQVLRKCNVTAASVELQEAHGSGVPEEDLTEINALRELYGERHTSLPTIGVSAVKSSIGHTLACAGIASLQKAALALYHRILPPMANTQRPHARLCHPSTPFYLIGEARPWIQSGMGAPRRAGVTALDFSGACGHVLLEAHPEGI